jgi:hypothetical protein
MKSIDSAMVAVVVLAGLLGAPIGQAAPLASATVTETKNEVVYKPAEGSERAAKVSDVVQGADVLRTGERSLAEIEFSDKTITRLGSKSVFTFSAGTREFHPGRGTTLIYMPKGLGGGRIVTSAITAAIQGTTVIVEETEAPPVTPQAAPRVLSKVIFLEGNGTVTMTEKRQKCPVDTAPIGAGQMIAQYSDDRCLNPVVDIDLQVLVKRSAIVTGFASPLGSMPAIEAAVAQQRADLQNGKLSGGGGNVYSPNPSTGSQGITDPPTTSSSTAQGNLTPVGGGFFISPRPLPGSQPIEGGGGFVVHP